MSDIATEPPLVGMPALEDAFLVYRELGLRIPPVPHTLVDALQRRSDGIYTTMPMNLEESAGLAGQANQVGFGQIGHGISSWFYCCRLVTPALAAYIRVGYGSAYVNDGSDAAMVNTALMQLEELVVAADDAVSAGKLRTGERMLVVLDVLDQSYFQAGQAEPDDSADPLSGALDWLS